MVRVAVVAQVQSLVQERPLPWVWTPSPPKKGGVKKTHLGLSVFRSGTSVSLHREAGQRIIQSRTELAS